MPSPKIKPQTTTAALPAAEHKSRSGAKVTVACKLPAGLLLRVFDMIDVDEPVMGGGMKTVKRAQQTGPMIRVNGTSAPTGMSPNCAVVGGFALTPNVDADFFARWMRENATLDAVVNKLIFAHEKPEMVEGEAKENRKLKSGLEPINPDPSAKDPRMTKGIKTMKTEDDSDK